MHIICIFLNLFLHRNFTDFDKNIQGVTKMDQTILTSVLHYLSVLCFTNSLHVFPHGPSLES